MKSNVEKCKLNFCCLKHKIPVLRFHEFFFFFFFQSFTTTSPFEIFSTQDKSNVDLLKYNCLRALHFVQVQYLVERTMKYNKGEPSLF